MTELNERPQNPNQLRFDLPEFAAMAGHILVPEYLQLEKLDFKDESEVLGVIRGGVEPIRLEFSELKPHR